MLAADDGLKAAKTLLTVPCHFPDGEDAVPPEPIP